MGFFMAKSAYFSSFSRYDVAPAPYPWQRDRGRTVCSPAYATSPERYRNITDTDFQVVSTPVVDDRRKTMKQQNRLRKGP